MATHQFSTCDLLTNLPQPHLNALFTQARTTGQNEWSQLKRAERRAGNIRRVFQRLEKYAKIMSR
ncbi:hypothetical protein M5D96_009403, partial [Drosophila gunungcola]